jgi:HAD superfamily hydrolase (TIGR01509 family)
VTGTIGLAAVNALVFDMDGVLVDSEPLHFEAARRILAGHGVPYTDADNRQFFGLTAAEAFRILRARHALAADASALAQQYAHEVVTLIEAHALPMPGVPDVLQRLHGAGFRLALASSSDPVVIAATLRRLGVAALFETVVSGADVTRGKPAPDIFVEAARRLGVPAEACLVIEDSRNGVLAAKAAAMACVAIPCRATAHEDFSEAALQVANLVELAAALLDTSRVAPGRAL